MKTLNSKYPLKFLKFNIGRYIHIEIYYLDFDSLIKT